MIGLTITLLALLVSLMGWMVVEARRGSARRAKARNQ